MKQTKTPSVYLNVLAAFALGCLAGLASLEAEAHLRTFKVPVATNAVYGILGGVLAASMCGLAALVRPSTMGAAAAVTAAALPAAVALYATNVWWLAGEPYLSLKSLAADLGVLLGCFGSALWLSRAERVSRPARWLVRPFAVLGLLLLVAQAGQLVAAWPREPAASTRPGADGPNLLLIMMDSVRRDHVGFMGHPQPTTPALDALSKKGRVYESAWSASSWTGGTVDWLLNVPTRALGGPLPAALARAGYVTACFTDNPHLGRGSDVVAGFDVVRRSVPGWRHVLRGTTVGEALDRLAPGSDGALVEAAADWARGAGGPVFLYAHLMDSHGPYDELPIDGRRRPGRRVEFPSTGMRLTPDETDDVIARYDGGIRSADEQAGRLIDSARGWGRPFLAIVTADHGESLGEEGRWYHKDGLRPELLAVPLMVLGEGVRVGRVRGDVGFASIATTLLAAAGVACPECGGSDLRVGHGDDVVAGHHPPSEVFVISGGLKLVHDRSTGAYRLFDLQSDPEEKVDLAQARTGTVELLARLLPQGRQAPKPAAEDLERLRSLGYVGR